MFEQPMILILIIVFVFISMFLFYSLNVFYLPKKRTQKTELQIRYLLDQRSDNYSLENINSKTVDLKLSLNGSDFLIKILKVNERNNIVITNKTTWIETERTGSLDIKNRIQSIDLFLKNTEQEKQVKKIAIIYPGANKILKYINENEMVFVTPEIDVYGIRIIRFNQLEQILNCL